MCTKLKVYYIKKLVTKKVCTKLKECTKSKVLILTNEIDFEYKPLVLFDLVSI